MFFLQEIKLQQLSPTPPSHLQHHFNFKLQYNEKRKNNVYGIQIPPYEDVLTFVTAIFGDAVVKKHAWKFEPINNSFSIILLFFHACVKTIQKTSWKAKRPKSKNYVAISQLIILSYFITIIIHFIFILRNLSCITFDIVIIYYGQILHQVQSKVAQKC